MITQTMFPELTFEEFINLFNRISQSVYFTYKLTAGEITQDLWKMKLRSIVSNNQSIIDFIDVPYQDYNLKDSFFYFKILSTERVTIYLVFNMDMIDDYISYYETKPLFSDSHYNMVYTCSNIFYKIEYKKLELFFHYLFYKISNDKFTDSNPVFNLSKLFNHLIYDYEDEWTKSNKNKELLECMIAECNKDFEYCKLKINDNVYKLLNECIKLD